MESRHEEKRLNVEDDRLSGLPDEIIHKILSCISLQEAIETSALSSRWRYMWTSMPCLNFSNRGFSTVGKLSRFVTHVLSRHNNLAQVSFVKLTFPGKVTHSFVKRIIDHAFSHNVQQLNIVSCPNKGHIKIPLSLFSSQSLKHLKLTQSSTIGYFTYTLTSTWDLPALTTLYLGNVKLNGENTDLFSNCRNLKNLTLSECEMIGPNGVKICHSNISNLTLEYMDVVNVNVEAPQLKDLILNEIDFTDITVEAARSLEKVDFLINDPRCAHTIVNLLRQLHNVKFLTLNLEIVELLSLSVEVISHQPSPFTDLKSLKIYPIFETKNENRYMDKKARKIDVSTVVKNYLLDSSPSATLTMLLREEIGAHKLMKELQMLLKQWKANSDQNTARMDQGKAENQNAQQETRRHFGERLTQIKSYWRDLNVWYDKGIKMNCHIISMLQKIEKLLQKLPTSHRAKMQPMFSGLCAEADTFMDYIIDRVRIQCDKKPRFSK